MKIARKERRPYMKQVNVISTPAMTEDGEVYTAQKKIQILQQDDKSFRMIFNEFMVFINSSDSLVDVKVFNWITDNLAYNSETIILNKFNKKKIAEVTGISYSSVEKAIGSLTAKKMLIRDDSCVRCGVYMVDPCYVWYGDTKAREGKLKMVLELLQNETLTDVQKLRLGDMKRYEEYIKEQEKEAKRQSENHKKEKKAEPKYETTIINGEVNTVEI